MLKLWNGLSPKVRMVAIICVTVALTIIGVCLILTGQLIPVIEVVK